MGDADITPRKQGLAASWTPGQSGNPAGRPKGSRNRLSEGFLAALCDDFEAHGAEAIRLAREADPVAYVRVCASLVPRLVRVEELDPYADMTDEELRARIHALNDQIAAAGGPRLCLPAVDEE